MPQGNSLGIISGLILVAAIIMMIASFDEVASRIQAPATSYELAGSSRPVK